MVFQYQRPLTDIVGLARLAHAEFAETAGTREMQLRNRVKQKTRVVVSFS